MRVSFLFCLLAAFLPLSGRLYAQQYYHLAAKPIDLNLQAEALLLLHPTVHIEQVLDARPDSTDLGIVQRGGFGTTLRRVRLRQGTAREVAAFLQYRLPPHAGSRPVLVRLTSLSIWEAVPRAFTLQTATELEAEYYAAQPDGTYVLLCRVRDNLHSSGPEPDRQYTQHLAELLGRGLQQVERVDWVAQQAEGPRYSLAQLQRPVTVAPFPIQDAPTLRAGVYGNFFEFRQNAPGQPGSITVDARNYTGTAWQGLRAVDPYLLTPEGQRVTLTDAWGFCDGRQVYIRQGKDYYLLERRGPVFMFFAPGYAYNNGGLMSGGPPKLPFSLNLQSGFVNEYTGVASGNTAERTGRLTHLIVYWRSPKSAAPLPVSINGAAAGQLHVGDYLSLPWQDNGQPVQLCVGAGSCLELNVDFTAASYLEYQPGAPQPLRPVPAREGAAQVNRMAGR